jgi:hypothetical protein
MLIPEPQWEIEKWQSSSSLRQQEVQSDLGREVHACWRAQILA